VTIYDTHPLSKDFLGDDKVPTRRIGPASWPEDYADRIAGKGCWLCSAVGKGDNIRRWSVKVGQVAELYLERRTVLPGMSVVIWNQGHVCEPTELDDEQVKQYHLEVVQAARAVQAIYKPLKLNLVTLGNLTPHLHTYILPRYPNDPAPGGPIPIEQIYSEEPIPDDELARQVQTMRTFLGVDA
jgi:diadenosine tetraphosphate (Ap4A) HIT family hydrolase